MLTTITSKINNAALVIAEKSLQLGDYLEAAKREKECAKYYNTCFDRYLAVSYVPQIDPLAQPFWTSQTEKAFDCYKSAIADKEAAWDALIDKQN